MIIIVAPHTVAEGQFQEADRMTRGTGESARKAPGFIARLVLQERTDRNRVWSVSCWANTAVHREWHKARQLPWTKEDVHRTFSSGAAVEEAELFAITASQGDYFGVEPPLDVSLATASTDLPYSVIASHVIDPSPEAMRIATEMIYEVGESAKKAPGFVGRLVIQSNRASNRIWSISSWARREDSENWVKTKKFWWTLDDVKKVFPEGALYEDAKRLHVVSRQLP